MLLNASIIVTNLKIVELDIVTLARLLGVGDRVEHTVVGTDAVAGELEGPVHGEEDGGVEHARLVVAARLLRLQVHHVHDLRDAEAASPVGPHHLVLEEPGREPNP